MVFTIKSSCGKYFGEFHYDGVCYVSLVNNKESHWFFDMIKPYHSDYMSSYSPKYSLYTKNNEEINTSLLYTPIGELSYFDGETKTVGGGILEEDLRDIVKKFDECFEWLDIKKDIKGSEE